MTHSVQRLHTTPVHNLYPLPTTNGTKRTSLQDKRIAIVDDWITVYAGAEKVLEQMLYLLPHSDLFSTVEFLPENQRGFLNGRQVHTSFIQKLPFARKKYRNYLPLMPLAIEQFDLSSYDVIVSSSYAVAKGAMTLPTQLHVSYVHSPMRYAWDLHFDYLREGGLERGIKGMIARMILHYMRLYDLSTANRVDVYVANSMHVARRIWKVYRRRAQVIYPPVDVSAFSPFEKKDNYYLTVSRLVPYKRIDLIVEAFSKMPDRKLVVIGDGPEYQKIAALAGPNVTLLGYQPFSKVKEYMERARAFVFAAEEDFGITPVEAQACGTPVIAFGKGGALETVNSGETGLFFMEQSLESIKQAVRAFEDLEPQLHPENMRRNAERFSITRFRTEFSELLVREYSRFISNMDEHII